MTTPTPTPTYADSLGEWLSTQPWTHFATLTTPYPLSVSSARRLAQRTLDRWKRITNTTNASMCYAIERNADGLSHHVHALFNFPVDIAPDTFQRLVDGQGHTDFQHYDPTLRGARYVAKAVTDKRDNWDLIN